MTGCAIIKQPHEIVPSEQEIAKYRTLPSNTAIDRVEKIYNNEKIKQLDFYAPTHFAVAGKALDEARALLAYNNSQDQITSKVAVADAVLKNGNLVMRRVKDQLDTELTLKNKLDSLNVESSHRTEYSSLLERLNGVIKEIENGNLISSEASREQLIEDMKNLERRSLYFNAMNEPQEILKRVKYRDGDQIAPITYKDATIIFERANQFIKQNPDNEQAIAQVGEEALFATKRALYITEAVTALNQKTSLSPEQIVLDEEYRLLRIARQIANADFRDHPLEIQSELIAKIAREKVTELNNKEEFVLALRDTLIQVRDSSSRLSLVSATAEGLLEEKNEWIAKEALYKAKVSDLKEQLTKTKEQLNSTQDTIIDITTENINITNLIEMKISEAKTLEAKINESQKDNIISQHTISALQAEIATHQKDKATQDLKISTLEEQLRLASANKEKTEEAIDLEKDRAKITKEETLRALQSAKELITTYQTANKSQDKKTTSEPRPEISNHEELSTETFVNADH